MKQAELLQHYAMLVRRGPHGLMSRGELERVEDHVADSAAGARLLDRLGVSSFVDVGSGGGFPGIPLAVVMPQVHATLVESQAWKAAFLQSVVPELNLASRVRVVPERAECAVNAVGREQLDCAVARAVASPAICAEYLAPFVRVGGSLVLWTTRAALDPAVLSSTAEQLGLADPIPHDAPTRLRSTGVLLEWPKAASTPDRFPRRPGMATKRPVA